jgi:hypothetical protein
MHQANSLQLRRITSCDLGAGAALEPEQLCPQGPLPHPLQPDGPPSAPLSLRSPWHPVSACDAAGSLQRIVEFPSPESELLET